MAATSVEQLVEGGKASAAPPLGPALGPLGVNIGQVVAEINKKTADFKGMKVPVKVEVNTETKAFTITVGTPPSSALVKKEAGIEKGSGNPRLDRVADLKIEQIIKVAKMKKDSLLGKDMFALVKEICGTCHSMGVLIEGMSGKQAIQQINEGAFKEKIVAGKTELTKEELKALEEEKKRLQQELQKRKAEFEAKVKEILTRMEGRPRAEIKAALVEAGIPTQLIEAALPVAEVKGGAVPAAGAKEPAKAAATEQGGPKK